MSRFVLHPILINRKSRLIFIWFLIISCLVGFGLWWKVNSVLSQAGLNPTEIGFATNWFESILFSSHFRAWLILGAAVVGGAFTAHRVVGPVVRIEEWLRHSVKGRPAFKLQVRSGDKFENLVMLATQLIGEDRK